MINSMFQSRLRWLFLLVSILVLLVLVGSTYVFAYNETIASISPKGASGGNNTGNRLKNDFGVSWVYQWTWHTTYENDVQKVPMLRQDGEREGNQKDGTPWDSYL